MAQVNVVADLLVKHPTGLSAQQLSKKAKLSVDSVYKAVDRLRRRGIQIPIVNGKYVVDGTPEPEQSDTSQILPGSPYEKFLDFLRKNTSEGVTAEEVVEAGLYKRKGTAQCAIMELRGMRYRIDSVDGRYFFKGKGNSFCTQKGRRRRIYGRQSTKNKGRKTASVTQRTPAAPRPTPQVTPPPAPAPKPAPASNDICVIFQDRIQEALKVLPQAHHDGLLETVKRMSAYNKAVGRFKSAENTLPKV